MANTSFRFSTDIIKRLGEELNPSAERSILELVKNSYDADAGTCTVELLNVDAPGGTLIIHDDGVGMDADMIQNNWLVLGRSGKSSTALTKKGRRPAGSKGLGRLAALRLGERAIIRTKRQNEPVKYELEIDWQQFENATVVEDVALRIESRKVNRSEPPGTLIEISLLHQPLGKMTVKRLARELLLLTNPFQDKAIAFRPKLVANEFKELEQLVSESYFKQADYYLCATLDENGQAQAQVADWKGDVLFQASHADLQGKNGEQNNRYNAPPCKFELWNFLLHKSVFNTRPVSIQEVQEWLAEFGGVHLYENGLRVSPYGDKGNDWLDMNLRRSRSPEERPSTNTSIGRVSIENTQTTLLQKTDRSGFIETEPFREIRRFAQNALDWMAKKRLQEAEKRRSRERLKATKSAARSKSKVDEAIQRVPKNKREDVLKAFEAYDRSKRKEVDALRKEVQLYRTLSTAGITAATFAHESTSNPIKVIDQAVNTVERRAKPLLGDEYSKTLAKPVESIRKAKDALGVLSAVTLRILSHDKRRWGRVDLYSAIDEVIEIFEPFFQGRQIEVKLTKSKGAPFLRGSEAAVQSIIANLLNNSVAAFERHKTSRRRIWITMIAESETFRLVVADNGPGIEGVDVSDIWLPGQTTKPNGTGLGLTIVRDAVNDMGGDVTAKAHGTYGGAEISVELPIIGV